MDVPLVLKDIGIRYGLKGYKRKSSMFSHKADVGGLSAFVINSSSNIGWLLLIIPCHKCKKVYVYQK